MRTKEGLDMPTLLVALAPPARRGVKGEKVLKYKQGGRGSSHGWLPRGGNRRR